MMKFNFINHLDQGTKYTKMQTQYQATISLGICHETQIHIYIQNKVLRYISS